MIDKITLHNISKEYKLNKQQIKAFKGMLEIAESINFDEMLAIDYALFYVLHTKMIATKQIVDYFQTPLQYWTTDISDV